MQWSSVLTFSMYATSCVLAANHKLNIIFYLTDDLGYNEWNSIISQTPNLHQLATEGTIMDRTITEPVCGPSRYAIMTGSNRQKGNVENGKTPYPEETLASYFNRQGYVTGMFGKDGLYPQAAPFHETFIHRTHIDAWEAFPTVIFANGNAEIYQENYMASKGRCLRMSQTDAEQNAENGIDRRELGHKKNKSKRKIQCRYAPYEFSIRRNNFIRQHAGKEPFFVYHSDPRPHVLKWRTKDKDWRRQCPTLDYGPYAGNWQWAPKPFNLRKWTDNQRGFMSTIWGIDQDIESMMSVLRETGQENNTLVIFTSDNGPELMFDNPFDLYMLKGAKRDTWENGIRNQAILWKPGLIPAGKINHCPWKVRDLLGSLSSIVGDKYLPEGSVDVSAAWLDESVCTSIYRVNSIIDIDYCDDANPCKWAHYDMRQYPAKLLKFVNSNQGPELYDVLADEREKDNLIGDPIYADYLADTYNYTSLHLSTRLRALI